MAAQLTFWYHMAASSLWQHIFLHLGTGKQFWKVNLMSTVSSCYNLGEGLIHKASKVV